MTLNENLLQATVPSQTFGCCVSMCVGLINKKMSSCEKVAISKNWLFPHLPYVTVDLGFMVNR